MPVRIEPGVYKLSQTGETLVATVHSGVCICIWDSAQNLGGMCHYLRPKPPEPAQSANVTNGSTIFGSQALPDLLRELKKAGSRPSNLKAWILGGAMTPKSGVDEGPANTVFAKQVLDGFEIPYSAKATGGYLAREIKFDTARGEVFFQTLHPTQIENGIPTRIRVLIIEDSKPIQKVLRQALMSDPNFEIIGIAGDPIEADAIRARQKPDVISLDLNLPKENGVQYLQRFMKTEPIPTLVVTGVTREDSDAVVQSLEAGAFDWLEKPGLESIKSFTDAYKQRLRMGAGLQNRPRHPQLLSIKRESHLAFSPDAIHSGLILIGASTGGTEAIKSLLLGLPNEVPPIIIVQHLPADFTTSYAIRLNEICHFTVQEAFTGAQLTKNQAWLAPGDFHIRIAQDQDYLYPKLELTKDPPLNLFRPSVDYMYASAASVLKNGKRKIVAALLTGMGDDGAKEMLALKNGGAWTIAQNEETCTVFGMPKAAIQIGAHREVLPLDAIASRIVRQLNQLTLQNSHSA